MTSPLADIADDARLQGILSAARTMAAARSGSTGDVDLLAALRSLHEVGGVLLIRWRSLAGFHRFASIVEAAWKAVGEWDLVHYFTGEPEQLPWANGGDPFDTRYLSR